MPSIMEKIAAAEREAMAIADPGETLRSALRAFERNDLVITRSSAEQLVLGRVITVVNIQAYVHVCVLDAARTEDHWFPTTRFKLLADANEQERDQIFGVDFGKSDEAYIFERNFLSETYADLPQVPKIPTSLGRDASIFASFVANFGKK